MGSTQPARGPGAGARTVRAGAFAAGGSLVALAACIALDKYSSLRGNDIVPELWFGSIAVALAGAVRFGEPTPPRGLREIALRTAGALVVGAALGAAALAFAAEIAKPPDLAVLVLSTAGSVLLAAAGASRRAASGAAAMQRELEGILAETLSDPPTPSPVVEPPTAAECERDAPAVEVRALWGGDVLRVVHLDPPRSLSFDDPALGLAIPDEAAGGARAPLVIAGGARVDVITPPGSTCIVSTEEAMGEPFAASAGSRIPVAKGTRVSVTLPTRAAGGAYRAPGGDAHPLAARLVLEVALVNAGRPARRGLGLHGRGPLLVATAIAGAAAALALAPGPAPAPDDDGVREAYALELALTSLDERASERRDALERELVELCRTPGAEPSALCADVVLPHDGPFFDDARLREACDLDEPWVPEELCRRLPRREPDRHPEPPSYQELCNANVDEDGSRGLDPQGSPFDAPAQAFPCNPAVIRWIDDPEGAAPRRAHVDWGRVDAAASIDARAIGLAGVGEGIGFAALDALRWPWPSSNVGTPQGFGGPRRGAPRIPKPPAVRFGEVSVTGALLVDAVRRVVRQSHGRFRLCYEAGLMKHPNLQGRVTARFVVDAKGQTFSVANGGTDLPDDEVVTCIARSFHGLSFPRPDRGTAAVDVSIRFEPGG